MPRPVLDPTDTGESAGQSTIERLVRRVRDFGFYPDINVLRAGDLILVSPVVSKGPARAIRDAQRVHHSAFDAQWTHAATYLGDNSLVELGIGGVRVVDLYKYIPTHRLLFRRPLNLSGGEISDSIGLKIAISALKEFNTKYSFVTIARIGWAAVGQAGASYKLHPRSPEAICSDCYNDAVAKVLTRGAASAKRNPFSPADLAASTNMIDVAISWVKLT